MATGLIGDSLEPEVPSPVGQGALVSNAAVYWIGEMATRGIQFAVLPILGHLISAREYGAYAAVGSLVAGFVTIAPLGVDAGIGRYLPGSRGTERREIALAGILAAGLASLVVAVPLLLVAPRLQGLESLSTPLGMTMLAASLVGGATGMVALSVLRARERSVRYAVTLVIRALVMAALLVGLWLAGASGTAVALQPLLWSWAVFGIAAVAVAVRSARVSREQVARLLAYGVPLVPHLASHWVLATSDRLLMQSLGDATSAGRYAFMYQLGMVVYLVGVSLNNAWAPRFMGASDERGAEGNRAVSPVFVSAVGLASIALAGCAPALVSLVSSKDYGGAEVFAPVLGAAFVSATVYLLLVNPLLKAGRTSAVSAATLTWAALNLAANVVLIPIIGAWGPAIVTFATYAGLSVTVAVLLGKEGLARFVDVGEVARSVIGCFLGLGLVAIAPLEWRLAASVPALALAAAVMGLYRTSRIKASLRVIRDGGRSR